MPFNIARLVDKYNLDDDEKKVVESLVIDESQREQISQYEQRSEEWQAARVKLLTASLFGAARGHCEYTSRLQLLRNMLWRDFKGNIATEWGTKHEAEAVDLYIRFQRKNLGLRDDQFTVTHTGLQVSLEHPWIGVSVDGQVFDDSQPDGRKHGLLEIKCPFGKKLYPFIPSQYYDQIQGMMGFLNLPWTDFVVWTPTQTQIRRFNFDKIYFEQELFPRLEQFYFTEFLPRLVKKDKGLIVAPYIDPIIEIKIDDDDGDTPFVMPSITATAVQEETPPESSRKQVTVDKFGHCAISTLLS